MSGQVTRYWSNTVKERRYGLMVRSMKATGEMAKQKEEVLSTIKTEMSILVSLKMTGQMDTVHMSMRME